MRNFEIFHEWESSLNESPEVSQTTASIKIIVGNEIVTQNDNKWSKSIHDSARLSAYPLALWFASSWWHLRWEPFPISAPKIAPSTEWRMSHEMMAAGYGYLWPRMLFTSDGEYIHIWSIAQPPLENNIHFRYLNSAYSAIKAENFEKTIDAFVNSVIDRLRALDIKNTSLQILWEELNTERQDLDQSNYRKLEALLGYDPDDCPQELIQKFEDLFSVAGATAVSEIAPLCVSRNPESSLNTIISFAQSTGLAGHIDSSISRISSKNELSLQVWDRGRDLAGQVRDTLGLNGNAITDETLCALFGLNKESVFAHSNPPPRVPGIAIRSEESDNIKFLFRKHYKPGIRFEIARFLGDFLMANISDKWLPVTDAKTSRQKTQRAFAAELLCPINALNEYLSDDYSDHAIDNAAEHFGVSSIAVQTQLVNNHYLPSSILGEYNGDLNFPYLI